MAEVDSEPDPAEPWSVPARSSKATAAHGIELSNVSKSFEPQRRGQEAQLVLAMDRVDLSAPQGQITAILGPSGCGKTTTLRVISGLEEPDDGHVWVEGEEMVGPDTWVPPEKRRVGFVFQQLALFPHLDVAGNVGFGLKRRERRDRVAEMLALVGLSGYEKRRPHELSGGQAQRVAVARALAPSPRAILLDEPFAALDVSLRSDVRAEVAEVLRESGTTTILVTHDQSEALSMGDRVIVMLGGRIAQAGTPDEVYRSPSTPEVAAFLGDANLLVGEIRGGMVHTVVGPLKVDKGAPAGRAIAMVRPEDLDLEVSTRGDGRVTEVEYFGHDQRVTVHLDKGEVVRARVHARRRFEVGSRVRVRAGAGLGPVIYPLSGGAEAAERPASFDA
jgi:iron(III) transport system ATP-binding protein